MSVLSGARPSPENAAILLTCGLTAVARLFCDERHFHNDLVHVAQSMPDYTDATISLSQHPAFGHNFPEQCCASVTAICMSLQSQRLQVSGCWKLCSQFQSTHTLCNTLLNTGVQKLIASF